jgi:hypothetical protein
MVKELLYQRADSIEVLSVNGGERRSIYADELESIQAGGRRRVAQQVEA